jgi:hypothetical protein
MKTLPAILVALFALSLAGCVIQGKPKAVAPPTPAPVVTPPPAPPPSQPLSMPQTEVHLPPPQPVDDDALARPTVTEAPAGNPAPRTPARSRTPRQTGPPPAPATTEPPPPATSTTEPERAPAKEMLPEAERTRLKNSAEVHRREIRNWLNSKARRWPANDPTVARIRGLMQASDDAEKSGDFRGAADWADRALLLMRELQK